MIQYVKSGIPAPRLSGHNISSRLLIANSPGVSIELCLYFFYKMTVCELNSVAHSITDTRNHLAVLFEL